MGDLFESIGRGPSLFAVIATSILLGLFASLHWWPLLGFTWAFYGGFAFMLGYKTCARHIMDAVEKGSDA
jgi:hypothetical protein